MRLRVWTRSNAKGYRAVGVVYTWSENASMAFQTACAIIEVVPLGGDLWFVIDNEADGGRLMHGHFHSLARDWVASRGKGNQNIKVMASLS